MKLTRTWLALLSCTLFIVAAACNGGDPPPEDTGDTGDEVDEETADKGEIVIGRNNWAENIAVSNMWKVLLEEEGYEVDIQAMDKAPVWVGITRGELDIAPEVWLPHTDEPLMDQYEDNVEMHDIWYENTGLGLVVPEYMDIDSIEDLNDIQNELDGRIVGIDPGASLTQMSEEAVDEYDLELDLVTSSDPAMIAEMSQAYNNEEPVVVTLWSPHWVFSEYDLKYLDDPQNVYGDPDDIYYMTRTGFSDDHPEIIEWMNNWEMDDDSLGSLMAEINDNGEQEGATNWIEENRELVDEWLE